MLFRSRFLIFTW